MLFTKTELEGAWLVEPTPARDARGWFARTFCVEESAAHGLETHFVQHSTSQNVQRGTLRGMHFQTAPHAEVKLVRCLKGAILDVIIDLNPGSPTYRQWDSVELTQDNRRMLYMPEGIAHGYLTLTDDVEAYYHTSRPWEPKAESGVRWNDPAFGISWPFEPVVISEKDRQWPLL